MFAGSVNGEDFASGKSLGLPSAAGFEGLWKPAEPDLNHAIAADALVDAASDGFHLRQFGHRLIVEDRDRSRGLSRIAHEFVLFFCEAALEGSPPLQINHAKDETDEENSH